MDTIYNLEWLSENIKNELDATLFFQQFNIIPKTRFCSGNHEMRLQFIGNRVTWRCKKKGCRDLNFSVRNDTWLEGSKIPTTKIILFIYHWTQENTSSKFCEKELKISSPTTLEFNRYLREVCASTLLNQPRLVGGEDKTVEIDHTYFTKSLNEGKMVPDQWVFGGICRETEEVFLCTIPDTTEDVIIQCIKSNIQPGTTIISECRHSYKNIEKIEGYHYKHLKVKNTKNIDDPVLDANTQSIDNVWFILKERHKKFCGINRKVFDLYLSEFVWRRRYANKNLFINILKDISTSHSLKGLPSPLSSKPSVNSEKGKRKKRKRISEESSKSQESECSLPRPREQTEENLKKKNVRVGVASTSGIKSFSDVCPTDPLRTPDDNKDKDKDNNNEDTISKHLQSREKSSGNILDQNYHELCPSSHFSCKHNKFIRNHDDVTEFDLFAKSLGKHLNNMPRDDALELQLKLEEVIENFQQQKSSAKNNNSSTIATPLCDENFIDIKMEIKEEIIE